MFTASVALLPIPNGYNLSLKKPGGSSVLQTCSVTSHVTKLNPIHPSHSMPGDRVVSEAMTTRYYTLFGTIQ